MKISMKNFRCHRDTDVILLPGLNGLIGVSGAGKSTVCSAIYFCLYGGAKWKNLTNKSDSGRKKKKTIVTIKVETDEEDYKITRERPTETVRVKDKISGKTYDNEDAQAWINRKFGTENSWIVSSYLAQEKDNFFMIETNANKKKLLNQLVFGDEESAIDPNNLASISEGCISDVKKKIDSLNKKIEIQKMAKKSLKKDFPEVVDLEGITLEDIQNMKHELKEKNKRMKELSLQIHDRNKFEENLKKIEKLSCELEDFEDSNSIREKISISEKVENLKIILSDFDERVLNYTQEELDKLNSSYQKLFSYGMDKKESASNFILRRERMKENYAKYMFELDEYNTSLNENANLEKENEKIREIYEMSLRLYENVMSRNKEIKSATEKYQRIKRKYDNIEVNSVFDNDDLSYNFAKQKIEELSQSTKELNCPHCNKGVLLSNSILIKGCTQSQEEKDELVKKLSLTKIQVEKRREREQLFQQINNFSLPTDETTEIEKPSTPTYKEVKKIRKPKTVPCIEDIEVEIPEFDYDTLRSLNNSFGKISQYKEYIQIKDVETFNVKVLKKKLSEYEKKSSLLQSLKLSVKDEKYDENLDDDEYRLKKEIKKLENKILLSDKSIYYSKLNNECQKYTEKRDILIKDLEELNYFRTEMLAIARDTIDDVLFSANSIIQEICSDLFEKEIFVQLKTVKKLKTTDEERENINLEIIYDGVTYGSFAELSVGEKKRISIAFLIAFSASSSSPVIIFDEVFQALDSELKKRVVKCIKKRCSNKFAINICHELSSTYNDNTINL